ncbi:short-chain collagen C4-like [Xenia sp. Carnegie-2017]|uniref:short-chain collagen C4-like n=1 Tax=Xenia sp. Carnegie-2017 TaxID=2897299 RepID=UPI001F047A1A|nr:short-chain collagen C4-like [Xenia sp. Carnegie-2017]
MLKLKDKAKESVFKRQNVKVASCRGLPGLPGRDGRDGRDALLRGPRGKQGKPGPAGPPGPESKPTSTGGVVYTRWGRKHCPKTTKTVEIYSGAIGGSFYSHGGSGSNYLCLPLNPIYEKYAAGTQSHAIIYGTEYEISSAEKHIFPNPNLHNRDAPCAVCHAKSRGSHMMIPARNICPSGWTLEYKGYLMAERHNHKRSEYICVDGKPEAILGSHANRDGALLYLVEGHCGSLPCPPYIHGKELTCVVCTQ